MKNVRRICVTIVGLLLLVSCEDVSKDLSSSDNSVGMTQNSTTTNNQEELTPVILGERLNNPFSVENMQLALNSLLEKPDELEGAGVSKRNAEVLDITPTDWYICFKVDSTQFNTLISDTALCLSQIPLDYDIIQDGDYLEDFQNSDIKTLYTVVKPGYTNPYGIDFEIIEELFIPENSEFYSDENELDKRSYSEGLVNNDFLDALLIQSFIQTGNEKFIAETKQDKKRLLEKIGRKTFYYPEGTVLFEGPNENEFIPVKGIKMVMWRWFTKIEAVTDENGYFKSNKKLNKILLSNNVRYYMKMQGQNRSYNWHLDANLFGIFCFWVNEYSLGTHSPDRVDFKIDDTHKAWRQCLVNNAVYDYVTNVNKEGLTLPPNDLRIAVGDNGVACSAPLFTKYYCADFEILLHFADAMVVDGIIGSFTGQLTLPFPALTLLKPDIMINCSNNYLDYYRVYSSVWHELNHGAHLQAMINNKGKKFAKDYWTTVVVQEASNYISLGESYGKKGDKNWEYIALAEGWANYREWKMCLKYLKYNTLSQTTNTNNKSYKYKPTIYNDYIEYRYAGLMSDLKNMIPETIIEEAISTSTTINQFRNYLYNNSYFKEKINEKFNKYEKLQ